MKKFALTALALAAMSLAVTGANAGGSKYKGPNPCMPGYQFYPAEQECIKNGPLTKASQLAEKAKCKPGEVRRTPDPSEPGGFGIQTCGYVSRR